MCDICNGRTFEESDRFIELTILHHGWALRGVHPSDDDPGGGHWTHTIGLLENFNHPELVITDTDYEIAGGLLNALGEDIRAGVDITDSTDPTGLIEMGYSFREVHPAHLDSDLLAGWFRHYGHPPAPGQVLQVVMPESNYCPCHANLRTDLGDPAQLPGSRRPNRAQRRALDRSRRRRGR